MPKTTLAWNPDEYSPVRERVDAFRTRYPTGRIVTELVRQTRTRVTFKALVYRTVQELEPAATGWASEREGDGEINATWHIENAETSAVGRALALLGFHATRQRPGGAATRHDAPVVTPPGGPLHIVRGAAPEDAPRKDAPPLPRASREVEADALLDALLLLQAAEREGLPAERVRAIRRALTTRSVAPSTRLRAEVELRAWLRDRRPGTH